MENKGHFWTMVDRLLLVMAIVGAGFSAGYNYRGLDAMATNVKALEKTQADGFTEIKTNYMRIDVEAVNQRRIDEQLSQIRTQLDRIETRLR